jgi:hypothetical protein
MRPHLQLYGLRYPFAMRSVVLAVVLAALPFIVIAQAQEPPALATVRNAPGFHTAAEGQFRGYEASLSTHCADVLTDWAQATHLVYGTPQTGADGNLVNATWVETVPGRACGQVRRYRVLVMIRSGKASVISVLPGESYAGPQLEHDAVLPLVAAVTAFVPKDQKCTVDVLDTHLVGSAPTASKHPWNEIWTIGACGKRMSVPIQFVPDLVGEGTSIHIESKAVTLLP